ncbi:Concanavalin A-like lectin/glucanases superfamily [uncultured Caudovirales phage]|uniref:Concanavalin A-like lectin/glucanases superfamily n=2 Tax=uncultured Caudovirales phage TaxID=2100421 RepID=A0A6J5NQV7_9CAUD|nr:Concanavalin A-like lectin/glucanases superfamily [uncultured Caudovirales phage]CAB4166566.1 Concanavalin A-like lectin/glucanases superfamily [uncultured Caudovirales phage]
MMDLYYIEEGYYDAGYYVYIANAVSAVSSTINSSCQAEKITSAQSSVSIQTSIFAAISHIEGADLFAFTNSSLSAQVDRFRDNDSQQSAAFTNAVSADRTRLSTGDFVSAVSLLIDFVKLKSAQADLLDNIFITCEGTRIQSVYIEGNADINAQGSVSAQAFKITDSIVALNAEFNQTASITHTEGTDMFAFTEAQIAIQVDRIRYNDIVASDVFNIATDFIRYRDIAADAENSFIAQLNAERSRDTNVNTQAAFSFDVTATLFKEYQASLSDNVFLTPTIDRIRNVDSTLSNNVSVAIQETRLRFNQSVLAAESNVNVSAITFKDALLTSFNQITLNATAEKTTNVVLSVSIVSSLTGLVGKKQFGNLNARSHFSIFVSRNVGKLRRPRNLIDNFVNGLPSFDSSIKKFGTHSLAGANNINFANYNQNNNVVPLINEDFYMDVWFYPNQTGLSYGIGGCPQFFDFRVFNGAFRFQPYIADPNNSSWFLTTFYRYTHTSTFAANQWYHLAVVKQGNSLAYYINGNRVYYVTDAQVPLYRWSYTQNTTYSTNIQFIANDGRIDEAFYWKGSSYGFNTTDTTISVPTAARINDDNPNIQYLYHFDNNVFDDVTLTQTGNANFINTSSVNASTNYVSGYRANINSNSSVNAIIGKLNEINLTAFDNAQLNATVGVIKQNSIDVEVVSNSSISNDRLRDNSIVSQIQTSITTNFDRFRNFDSFLLAESQSQSTAIRIKLLSASLLSEITLTSIIGKQQGIDLFAFTNGSLDTQATVIRNGVGEIQSNFTLSISYGKIPFVSAEISSQVSINADNTRVRFANIQTESIATELVVSMISKSVFVSITGAFDTDKPYAEDGYVDDEYATNFLTIANYKVDNLHQLSSVSVMLVNGELAVQGAALLMNSGLMTIQASKSTTTSSIQLANSNIQINAVKIANGIVNSEISVVVLANVGSQEDVFLTAFNDVSLTVTATKSVNVISNNNIVSTLYADTFDSLNIKGSATITSNSQVAAQADRIRQTSINLEALFFELADGDVSITSEAVCQAQFNVSVNVQRIRTTSVSTTSNTSLTSATNRIRQAQITISSAMTFVAEVRDLRLDEIEYKIPAEGWEYQIVGEDRTYDIIGETRLRKIVGETRNRSIDGETRIYIIE